ncbi:MAG: LysM peptidoglycan-binding domain-containing protein [Acidimicrobiia bacterium]
MSEPSRIARASVVVALLLLVVAAGSADYTVRPGDTLAEIARNNGVSVSDLAAVNHISDSNLIRVGQQLTVPGPSLAHPTENGPAGYHVVERGESLSAIAIRHGTTVDALAAANGIVDHATVYEGTRLRLSGTAFVATAVFGETSHVVTAGETLGGIAKRFGTSVSNLATANQIADPNRIRVGAALRIPTSAWVCPVEGATYFNDWGFPRSGGRSHDGNDLFASRGTEVKAPVGGIVEQLSGSVAGFQFRLYGDDGHLYFGSHMDAPGHDGRVTAGTVIGYVGDSGNAAGSNPHLHFEIHPNGGRTANPYPSLQANGC